MCVFIQLLLQLLLQLPLQELLQSAIGLEKTGEMDVTDNIKIGKMYAAFLKKSLLLIIITIYICFALKILHDEINIVHNNSKNFILPFFSYFKRIKIFDFIYLYIRKEFSMLTNIMQELSTCITF